MKNRILLPLAVAAMALGSAAAFAETATTSTIKTIDTTKHELIMEGGEVYTLPAGFDVSALKVGEKVSVEYRNDGSNMEVVSVKPAA